MTKNAYDPSPGADKSPRVIEAERLGQGVFITFATGEVGFFSAMLLYDMLPHIEKVKGDFHGWPGL